MSRTRFILLLAANFGLGIMLGFAFSWPGLILAAWLSLFTCAYFVLTGG